MAAPTERQLTRKVRQAQQAAGAWEALIARWKARLDRAERLDRASRRRRAPRKVAP